jgi:GNAT superfamily N-acetyltransferase
MAAPSTASPPKFTVSLVTSKDDFPGMARVEKAAFANSQFLTLMWPPSPTTPENFANTVHNHEKAWATDPNAKYLKAALDDEAGTIIGIAKWYFFLDPENQADPWKIDFPPGANEALYNEFFGALNKAREERFKGKRHILMAVLAIHPDYQRMGVGHELLRWGLDEADREQVPTWIDASAAGFGLYKKFGWEEVGWVKVDAVPWGGKPTTDRGIANMIREPKPKK